MKLETFLRSFLTISMLWGMMPAVASGNDALYIARTAAIAAASHVAPMPLGLLTLLPYPWMGTWDVFIKISQYYAPEAVPLQPLSSTSLALFASIPILYTTFHKKRSNQQYAKYFGLSACTWAGCYTVAKGSGAIIKGAHAVSGAIIKGLESSCRALIGGVWRLYPASTINSVLSPLSQATDVVIATPFNARLSPTAVVALIGTVGFVSLAAGAGAPDEPEDYQ